MKHYLYGLTIHSIQSYIFQTNKLKEIAGASELVEQICTTEFAKMINKDFNYFKNDPCAIRNAAGNVRYIFEDLELCKTVIREFPKRILEFSPGVKISQSVVEAESKVDETHFALLEKQLNAQKNSPIRPIDLGYMAVNRSRRTGLPSIERKEFLGDILITDKSSLKKQEIIEKQKKEKSTSRVNSAFFGADLSDIKVPVDANHIVATKSSDYSWLAVIHADGNNMGKALQNLEKERLEQMSYSKASKIFSEIVDKSTKSAAQDAFRKIGVEEKIDLQKEIPFRPIIVGGDDLTVVCRADRALTFAKYYLEEFENHTRINFSNTEFNSLKNGLTACAGIAFVKVNYPFHYAVELAEKLCAYAKKKVSRNEPTPSCVMFHKVQDSFVESYDIIIERELKAHRSECRFNYGPYYLNELDNVTTINSLVNHAKLLSGKAGNAIKSSLRQWLSDLHEDKQVADQRMKRLLSIGSSEILSKLGLNNSNMGVFKGVTPVYDWLTILSINQFQEDDNN